MESNFQSRYARSGRLKIGDSQFNVDLMLKGLRALGGRRKCYVYKPKKDQPLIIENENKDRIFIAPIATSD